MNKKIPAAAIAATLLGINTQLYTTRMNTLLKPEGLTLSQFSLLNHLINSKQTAHSISDLTQAMELNQPGVTKIVQKLQEAELINVNKNKDDSRKREVSISLQGQRKVMQVNQALFPDIRSWFQDWTAKDIEQFTTYNKRLASWFNTHRLDADD